MAGQNPIKHFLQFSDFSRDEFEYVIERAARSSSASSRPTRSTTRWSTARW
jgi:ornithine carbamoyltransferase